jgi:transcriptional regulator with XRE-family HTH domain
MVSMLAMTEEKRSNGGQQNRRVDGSSLRYFRDMAHLTLHELDDLSGVSYTTISRIENGVITKPRWSTLKQLAGALGVDVEQLVVRREPPSGQPSERLPDEPGLTEENISKIEQVRREKKERDERARREDNSHDSRNRRT